jgi:hypothetical protein
MFFKNLTDNIANFGKNAFSWGKKAFGKAVDYGKSAKSILGGLGSFTNSVMDGLNNKEVRRGAKELGRYLPEVQDLYKMSKKYGHQVNNKLRDTNLTVQEIKDLYNSTNNAIPRARPKTIERRSKGNDYSGGNMAL